MSLPLQNHEILNTASVNMARERVGSVYCDHQLVPLTPAGHKKFHALHNYAPINRVSINSMTYSSKVLINPGCLDEFYLLQLPLTGNAEIETGTTKFESDSSIASLINPSEETSMIWHEGCEQLMVQIERTAVEEQLSKLAQCEVDKPLVFCPTMKLDNGKTQSWWRFIRYLVEDIDGGCFYDWGATEKAALENSLITNLLYALPHNYSTVLENSNGAIAPKHVKQAEAFMLDNMHICITIDDLVAITGVSARSLFDGFKRFRGVTPMKRFMQFKMHQIRQDLQNEGKAHTVTEILARYGITQQGRFAAYYKKTFGETPSQTIRNS